MNPRPPGYEPDELPNCSTPRYFRQLVYYNTGRGNCQAMNYKTPDQKRSGLLSCQAPLTERAKPEGRIRGPEGVGSRPNAPRFPAGAAPRCGEQRQPDGGQDAEHAQERNKPSRRFLHGRDTSCGEPDRRARRAIPVPPGKPKAIQHFQLFGIVSLIIVLKCNSM